MRKVLGMFGLSREEVVGSEEEGENEDC